MPLLGGDGFFLLPPSEEPSYHFGIVLPLTKSSKYIIEYDRKFILVDSNKDSRQYLN